MPPTEEQVNNRSTALDQIDSGVLQDSEDFTLPEQEVASDFGGFAEGAATDFLDTQAEAVKLAEGEAAGLESQGSDFQSQILGITESLGGEGARQRELEAETGFTAGQEQLRGISSELQALQLERARVPLDIQAEGVGRTRTTAGIAPIQADRLRTNAIQTLTTAAQGAILQGNVEIAQRRVQQALDAEFEPQRLQLQTLTQQYLFNKDSLERVDKKRADALNIALAERSRLLGIQEANKKNIYDIGLMAKQFGADTATVNAVFESRTPEEAVSNAGAFLQDPAAQQELANAKLAADLTKLRIQRERIEIDLLDKYGGLTPEQWQKKKDEEAAADAKATGETDLAVVRGREITNDLNQVSAILNSSAIDTVVGPTLFARGGQRTDAGFASRFLKGAGTAISLGTGGAVLDELSGNSDDLVSSVEQMTSTLFLDKLISVKGQGATFGQLSDREGAALRNAAQSISQTAIRDNNDRVIGYDMSEKEFKKQIGIVQERLQHLYKKTTGDAFTEDEQAIFDAIDEAQAGFDPTF